MLLKDKVALVTGAASGIGRATAQAFAREGAQVIVSDVNETGGQETVESIRAAAGDAAFVRADVGKMDDVQALVQATLQHYGRLDVLHSNAAAYTMGSATGIDESEWDRTINVCLKATWMLAHHAVPSMLDQGSGVIITTGSNHAIQGYAHYAAYQAAKGGMLALTRSLAADFAPTIRANAILPGAVVTDMWSHMSEEEVAEAAQRCPLKRNGRPEDIAQAALFLASDMSSFMTGTYLLVDGGSNSIMPLPTDNENPREHRHVFGEAREM